MSLVEKVSFDEKTLEILRNLKWSEDGLQADVTEQLDRPSYEKFKKALVILGGKWNKKAHVFQNDPRPMVEGLLQTRVLEIKKEGFFETPEFVVERMIALSKISDLEIFKVLEPSAGLGRIAKRLSKHQVVCVELNPTRFKALEAAGIKTYNEDFMKFEAEVDFDFVFMNPPFENQQDIRHVLKAFTHLKKNGTLVSILSEGAFFRKNKLSVDFRKWLDENSAYIEELSDGAFKESGTMANTRLVMIKNGNKLVAL